MAKNKKNEPEKKVGSAQQHSSDKQKRDGKNKKSKPEDHLSHIPFRLREIMKSKEKMKRGTKKVKDFPKSKPKNIQDGDIPIPHFRRKQQESVKAYMRRMNTETSHVLFLTKNQVERRPELEKDKQEQPANKGKSEKKKEYDKGRLQRLHQKKLDRQAAMIEKEMFLDDVPFGEVSMAPPSLTSKPRKAPVKPQKASKELLLNSLLGHTAASVAKPSMARQRIMEEERLRAVEAYRHLKKQRQQQQEARAASLEKLKNPQ